MQRNLRGLITTLLFMMSLPAAAFSQEATPVPDFGLADSVSPVSLYEALLATPFPDALLPEGVAALDPYEWRDSNDRDLAGAIGGVIFADGDPFGSQPATSIAYMIYSDANGPQAPLATAAQAGEPAELLIDGQAIPAVLIADAGEIVGLFTAVDNVFVFGMVPTGVDDAEQVAASLTRAGIAHLLDLATSGAVAGEAPVATPGPAATRPGEDPFLALAAAPFPAAEIPFDVGDLVVLPVQVSSSETASGVVGALLVRDADRIYPYPLVMYRFYADESAALDYVSQEVRRAGMSTLVALPPEIEIPHPTTLIDDPDVTTTALVQVGTTIVIGYAPFGTPEERQVTAMTLAQIAVSHLEDVAAER